MGNTRNNRLRKYCKKGWKRTRNAVQILVTEGYVKPIWVWQFDGKKLLFSEYKYANIPLNRCFLLKS
ncbi:hypothetical protein R7V75_01670 [Mesomycoplasma ovipneumoniae]|uniref:Uncharacterized protein n=1 Tax=Mesomycoplasma ovipneumoniae TaxID=29562 RepID=A0AAJ2P567_9BACT|nr:hypothetical protein [Mesomycoplasma ovipneumoniae]MDW2829875.1 hypothetical protein [Mesomycoplasma ovipneumoniae]MDW2835911.1 hypothetical protein [Mesomycoplasma ovipneumoniae]MDW2871128.1 hypothetical protein [Mesomycoplasma ovipneumoniae]MDW2892712.1 hypothetical protein [Mesomycoplasma ovipneumoniae]MDW2908433.1 hypothetical protein [Mesomycoplasma ovipneumoniae]